MHHAADLDASGSFITPAFLPSQTLDRLRSACAELAVRGGGARAGVRNLTSEHHAFADLAASAMVRDLVGSVLGAGAFVARSILFDKSPDRNWDVVWHQDTTIAVAERLDTPGFGPWSVKRGVVHVQPPAVVLERMLTVRIHLDDCGPGNGPLLVVPGSHCRGIIPDAQIDAAACERDAVACHAPAGAAVLMRPLLLHASKKAEIPAHRRVIHLEFAADELPGGLRWARS